MFETHDKCTLILGQPDAVIIPRGNHTFTPKTPGETQRVRAHTITTKCSGRVQRAFFGIEVGFTLILEKERQSESVLYLSLYHLHVHTTPQSLLPPTLLRKQRSLCNGHGEAIFFIQCLPLSLAQPRSTHANHHHLSSQLRDHQADYRTVIQCLAKTEYTVWKSGRALFRGLFCMFHVFR